MDKFRVYFNNYNRGNELVLLFINMSKTTQNLPVQKNYNKRKRYFVDISGNLREEFLSFLKSHANTYGNSNYDFQITFSLKSANDLFVEWKKRKN